MHALLNVGLDCLHMQITVTIVSELSIYIELDINNLATYNLLCIYIAIANL